jgi:hypothetical protein
MKEWANFNSKSILRGGFKENNMPLESYEENDDVASGRQPLLEIKMSKTLVFALF